MLRVPRPDLIADEAQTRAYAEADFGELNRRFIERFDELFADEPLDGYVLDLGCGPGVIALDFAGEHPDCVVHGVDASEAMLHHAEQLLARHPELSGCVEFLPGRIPGLELPQSNYRAIISNCLLHHMGDPGLFWRIIREHGAPGAPVLVMDLVRPGSEANARDAVQSWFGVEPELLRRYLFNALLAAFEPEEVVGQLHDAGLTGFQVERFDECYLMVSGRLPARAC